MNRSLGFRQVGEHSKHRLTERGLQLSRLDLSAQVTPVTMRWIGLQGIHLEPQTSKATTVGL